MGLDISHGCWHGAYSAFYRWRNGLSAAAGYTFHKEETRDVADIDWGHVQRVLGPDLAGEWPAIPVRPDGTPDPLIILIAHSDCDGRIVSRYCAPLADRLAELLPLLPDEDVPGHIGNWHTKTQTFIDGLRRAAAAGEDVDFH